MAVYPMSKPGHVQRLESGGYVCRHCGADVDDAGYYAGGEVDEPPPTKPTKPDESESETKPDSLFAMAMKKKFGGES